MAIKTFAIRSVLFLLLTAAGIFGYYHLKKYRQLQKQERLGTQIGKIFQLKNLVDSSGRPASVDFSQTPVNIIDFWFRRCPSCILEMQQFKDLLKGRENETSITSISIDGFGEWKQVLEGKYGRLSFVASPSPNWKHLAMLPQGSSEDAYTINSRQLNEQFGVSSYPSVLVTDNKGNILSISFSAVDVIRSGIENKSGFVSFISKIKTWLSLPVVCIMLICAVVSQWAHRLLTKGRANN
jgi:thiol-disulfide isomerase/thioredoxin